MRQERFVISDRSWAIFELLGPGTSRDRGVTAVIPARRNRKIHIPHDEEAYKRRHLIENYFSKNKE
jgi:transposase